MPPRGCRLHGNAWRLGANHTGSFVANRRAFQRRSDQAPVSGSRSREMAVSSVAQQRSPMRFRGRSYMAFALTPEPPIVDWLAELDSWIRSSAGFFVGRPVVLDLTAVTLTSPAIAHLIGELGTRNIRIMGIEGVEADKLGPGLPPLLKGGRAANVEAVDSTASSKPAPAARKEPNSLLLEAPVRSGQSIF